jgi:hypothetical protein
MALGLPGLWAHPPVPAAMSALAGRAPRSCPRREPWCPFEIATVGARPPGPDLCCQRALKTDSRWAAV